MPTDNKDGSMISRSVGRVPTDPRELAKFLTVILTNHYQDIEALYSMCTDTDLFEQKQRDNASS